MLLRVLHVRSQQFVSASFAFRALAHPGIAWRREIFVTVNGRHVGVAYKNVERAAFRATAGPALLNGALIAVAHAAPAPAPLVALGSSRHPAVASVLHAVVVIGCAVGVSNAVKRTVRFNFGQRPCVFCLFQLESRAVLHWRGALNAAFLAQPCGSGSLICPACDGSHSAGCPTRACFAVSLAHFRTRLPQHPGSCTRVCLRTWCAPT